MRLVGNGVVRLVDNGGVRLVDNVGGKQKLGKVGRQADVEAGGFILGRHSTPRRGEKGSRLIFTQPE